VDHEVFETDGVPIRAWVRGVQLEDAARRQLENVARLPIVFRHVAAMPDVHWGIGATVGSVIATEGAIIPAAVGVDIGCGMMAVETSLTASDLPDHLGGVRTALEAAIPHGRSDNGGSFDRGAWRRGLPARVATAWNATPTTTRRWWRSIPSSAAATTPTTSARSAPATTSSRCASTSASRCG
jgi:tRNA-splicing ligase RtcB